MKKMSVVNASLCIFIVLLLLQITLDDSARSGGKINGNIPIHICYDVNMMLLTFLP